MEYIVNFSGGKDSTAMLLMLLEKGMQVDEIIFVDTGKEFRAMHEHIKKVEQYIGREITILKPEKTFDYLMFDHIRQSGEFKGEKGLGWATMTNRWCTGMKVRTMEQYLKGRKVTHYIGIAADEPERHENKPKNVLHPLFDWGVTEEDALQYCYSKGFDWGGLYEDFDRVSCWCCPLQSMKNLKTLHNKHHVLWQELKAMDRRARNKFKKNYTVEDLEEKFNKEDEEKKLGLTHMLGIEEKYLVQKVKSYQEDKIKFPCIVQQKYDGVYCIAFFDNQGIVGIFSATGKEYLSLEHLKPQLELCRDMSGDDISFIIFEAYSSVTAQPIVSGWCRDEQNQHPEIFAYIHDILTMGEYMGIDKTPYSERIARLIKSNIETHCKSLFLPLTIIANEQSAILDMAETIWFHGGEGVIIKNPNAPYSRGKRNWDLIKLKQNVSYDLKVIGIEEGQGRCKDAIGRLVLQWKDGKTITVGTGLTALERKRWWDNKGMIVGKIVQIDAMKESTGGILREPVFKGIRHDKSEPDF